MVTWLPSDSVFLSGTTCDPAQAGVFTQNLTNQNGCDSVVTTTVSLLPASETFLATATCDPSQAGVFTTILSNQYGCDSVVVETVTLLPSNSVFLFSTTCDPSETGVFVQNLIGQNGCDSVVTTTVSLLQSDSVFIAETTCDPAATGIFTQNLINQNGCDSTVTTTVALLASDTAFLASTTCDAAQAGIFTMVFTNQNGCDSVVVEEATWTPPPTLALDVSDFNGWAISCTSAADGSIVASATGAAPLGFAWSDGSAAPQIAGLPAGGYSLTVTDANGCTATAGALLAAPQPLQVSFVVNNLDCFEENGGAIFVQAVGGAAPLRYSLDGLNFQDANAFENLGAGAYQATVLDANGCGATELILINAPVPVEVDLGEDLTIELGEGAELQALVNVPLDSLAEMAWTGLGPSAECPACPQQTVFPLVTTSYSVTVTDNNGCRGEDGVTVFVDRRKNVYVPNAFSPNGDGANDVFQVFAKPGTVKNIRSFLVFDRWGEAVWQYFNFLPGDPAHGWDGTHRGEAMGPQVLVWFAEVEFTDGKTELLEGDVALVR
jgi:gliding motility-associated-like protein